MARVATGNRDDAMDVVQDAMYKLVERYSDRPSEEWPPLFYRIVQSRIRDWMRRETVRGKFRVWFGGKVEESPDPVGELADTRGRNPAQLLEQSQQGEALQEALAQLPYRQQQIFMLRAWEGLSVRQTADVVGVAEGSVKTHYSRAVHRLRERLGAVWP